MFLTSGLSDHFQQCPVTFKLLCFSLPLQFFKWHTEFFFMCLGPLFILSIYESGFLFNVSTWLHIYSHRNTSAFKGHYGFLVGLFIHLFNSQLNSYSPGLAEGSHFYGDMNLLITLERTENVRAFVFRASVSLLHSWRVIGSDMVHATCKVTSEGAAFVFAMADSRKKVCK